MFQQSLGLSISTSFLCPCYLPSLGLLFLLRSSLPFTSLLPLYPNLSVSLPFLMHCKLYPSQSSQTDSSISQVGSLPFPFSSARLFTDPCNQAPKVALGLFPNAFLSQLLAPVNLHPTIPQTVPWFCAFISQVASLNTEGLHHCFLTLLNIKIWNAITSWSYL